MYEETPGITHLLEHILCRRLDDLNQSELYKELDKYGLCFNGAIYSKTLCFEVSGNIKFFRQACDVLVKLLAPPCFTDEDLKAERKRICREIEEDDKPNTIDYLINKCVWKDTALGRYASSSAVKKISLAKLKAEKEKIFTSENMFFYATGAVSEEDIGYLGGLIEKYNIPFGTPRNIVTPVTANFLRRGPDVCVKKPSYYNSVAFSIEYDAEKYTQQEIDLLYAILFFGNSAALYLSLSEERGLIYGIDDYRERYANAGVIYFSYEIEFEDLHESIKASAEVLYNVKTEISDFDFNRAVTYYTENVWEDDVDTVNGDMSFDNHCLNYGYKDLDEYKKLFLNVSKERLQTVANEILRSENICVAVRAQKKVDADLIKKIISDTLI